MPDLPMALTEDALTSWLLPFWQVVIAFFALFLVTASVGRLARRGRTRMTTALLLTGGALVAIAVVGILLQQ